LRFYGSSGAEILAAPEPIVLSAFHIQSLTGPTIEFSRTFNSGSGGFEVDRVIARVFPAFKVYALGTQEELGPDSIVFGPYPHDILRYKSTRIVEYTTPAQTDGMGTRGFLKKDTLPIRGAAILAGDPPELYRISVRLPTDMGALASAIIDHAEREAAKHSTLK